MKFTLCVCMPPSRVSAVKSSIFSVLFTAHCCSPNTEVCGAQKLFTEQKSDHLMNPLVPTALTRNCLNVASALSSLDPLAKGTASAQLSPRAPGEGGLNIPSVWATTLATNAARQSLSLYPYLYLSRYMYTYYKMIILKQFLAMLILDVN